jgi:hypothetical protein
MNPLGHYSPRASPASQTALLLGTPRPPRARRGDAGDHARATPLRPRPLPNPSLVSSPPLPSPTLPTALHLPSPAAAGSQGHCGGAPRGAVADLPKAQQWSVPPRRTRPIPSPPHCTCRPRWQRDLGGAAAELPVARQRISRRRGGGAYLLFVPVPVPMDLAPPKMPPSPSRSALRRTVSHR